MSFSNDELMLLAMYVILDKQSSTKLKKKKSRKGRLWMKSWYENRGTFSHVNLINELRFSDPDDFRNYLRMDEDSYVELLTLVSPYIEKKDTVMRAAISAHERLSATLRFLATGRKYEDMKYSCAFSKASLCLIIPETCRAIYTVLMQDYMKFPQTEEHWESIARDFEEKWQFPHCLGAIDGKHIAIVQPPGSGSYYFNYKKFHSIVLMAIANANYEIIFCDVGTNGRISDGGVIENTPFYDCLTNGTLRLPEEKRVGNSKTKLPYVFVGDDAFTMRTDLLKPFSHSEVATNKRVFNLRLCRARRIIENVFGILAQRFQVFHSTINLKLESIEVVVLGACVLHNYLRKKSINYIPDDVIARENPEFEAQLPSNENINTDESTLTDLQRGKSRNCKTAAKKVRENFMKYFMGEGQLDWQWKKIQKEYNTV